MSFEDVACAVAASPAVAAAWVFGSLARNEARPDSDLDVALLLRDREATAVTCRRAIQDLAARLETVSRRRVDLVVLTLNDPIIAHRVLSEGRLVLDADPERRIDFSSDALARYFDWAPRYEAAAARSLAASRAWSERQSS
ncbi:MAG: nucleotidyltransferase domain-containing protein [Myxococcota bacterium]